MNFYHLTNVSSIFIDSPILFNSYNDLNSFFNLNLIVYRPQDALGAFLNDIVVDYVYTFVVGDLLSDGSVSLDTVTVRQSDLYSVSSDYTYIPLFNSNVLTENVIADFKNFSGLMNNKFCYLTSAGINLVGVFSKYWCFTPINRGGNLLLSDYTRIVNERFRSIYQAESYEEHIVFEDLSWTDWLVNSVSGFLDFQIVPGLSFAGMLGLLVGMSLFIVFLKVFAGG